MTDKRTQQAELLELGEKEKQSGVSLAKKQSLLKGAEDAATRTEAAVAELREELAQDVLAALTVSPNLNPNPIPNPSLSPNQGKRTFPLAHEPTTATKTAVFFTADIETACRRP